MRFRIVRTCALTLALMALFGTGTVLGAQKVRSSNLPKLKLNIAKKLATRAAPYLVFEPSEFHQSSGAGEYSSKTREEFSYMGRCRYHYPRLFSIEPMGQLGCSMVSRFYTDEVTIYPPGEPYYGKREEAHRCGISSAGVTVLNMRRKALDKLIVQSFSTPLGEGKYNVVLIPFGKRFAVRIARLSPDPAPPFSPLAPPSPCG